MRTACCRCRCVGFALALTAVVCLPRTDPAEAQEDPLDKAFGQLLQYDWGPVRDALAPIDVAIVMSHGNPDARRNLEDRFLEVLRADAPRGAKSFVCRKLREIGTARSVSELAKLLGDVELGHMARSALESIQGAETMRALCDALPTLDGTLRIGAIHSLGRLGDVSAVEVLTPLLKAEDRDTVKAAVVALSQIDSPDAVQAVLAVRAAIAPDLQTVVTDACLRIARRQLAAGQSDEAARILNLLESSDAEQVRCAVLLGLWQAEPSSAHPRLMRALASDNDRLGRFATELVREQADSEMVRQLAGELHELPHPGQVRLLDALSQRRELEVRAVAVKCLQLPQRDLQCAALHALASSGQSEDVELLAKFATEDDPTLRDAAQGSLEQLEGEGVDEAILDAVEAADRERQVALIRAISVRRIANAASALLSLAQLREESVRVAALTALQAMADGELADELARLLAGTRPGAEREAAECAVWRSCSRIGDESKRIEPILNLLDSQDAAGRAALLPALGRLGGVRAREVVDKASQDNDEDVRDAAVRALSNWPDASVAEQLLDLAQHADKESHRVWALRGYARVIARQGKEQPQLTADGLREVMQLAHRVEDKKLILSRVTAARVPDSLALTLSLIGDADLRTDAMEATVSLAEGMKESHPKEARAALERVQKMTQDPELQLYVVKLLWNMQLKGN